MSFKMYRGFAVFSVEKMFLRTVASRTRRAANHLSATCSPNRCYAVAVLKSPYEDITIPRQTLTQFVWSRSSQWEDLPAMTCGISGRSYTYGMAKLLTEKFAKGLVDKLPMKPGDRIGFLMPNLPEYLVAIHGCIDAGFVPTFANPLYTTDEVTRQFTNAGVRCIVTIPQLLDNAIAVAANLKNYTYTINAGGKSELDRKILALQEVLTAESNVKLPEVNPEDIACLPYSSGTTGLPKGVALTHRSLVANIIQCNHPDIGEVLPATSAEDQERVLSVLPFFHIYGLNAILNFLTYNGVHTVTMPRFTPSDYLRCLEEYRPTSLFAVPSLVLFIATHPTVTSKHLESVKRIICAAAPITPNIIKKFREKVNRDDFIFEQGYGMTELSPVALFTPRSMEYSKTGSVGRLLPSTEAKLIDLTDNEIVTGPHKSGELLIRGPQVMKGYFNNHEATAEILDSEGWLHTGDVAYYDEDGYFYIIDRTKELIKVKGNQGCPTCELRLVFNKHCDSAFDYGNDEARTRILVSLFRLHIDNDVSPTELESLLIEIPGVSDCAVVGIPDNAAGELPRAFIVKTPGYTLTVDDIKNCVHPKVARYKKLEGGIIFIDAIPRNTSGKIMRQQLKSMN